MGTAINLMSAQPVTMDPSIEFADLYERHYAAVFYTALRITGNPADAEDVLQTVFLRVLNRAANVESAHTPEAYFRRAAVNGALDLLRRRVSHREEQLEQAQSLSSKEDSVFLKEQLRRALAAIDPADAALFLLRYVEGLTNGELAEMFDQEKNSIAVRLHRIRQSLQVEMERV